MNILLIILIILALIIFLPGIFVKGLSFLIWLAVAVLVIAGIVYLVRYIGQGR